MSFIQKVLTDIELNENQSLHIDSWKTYINEALWGWEFIAPYVNSLPIGSQIFEIGAGPQALSAQVASKGMLVTAIEPSGSGFSIMTSLGEKVRNLASESGITYKIIDAPGEEFIQRDSFDFAFSINVMEHVGDFTSVLDNVLASLKIGATYHFVCPNYAFPFEPHFNIPTLINKRLTDKYLSKYAIASSPSIDPEGLWDSLNWISVRKIRRWARCQSNISIQFSNRALEMYVTRSQTDPIFVERHKNLARISKPITKVLLIISRFFPKSVSPFIDVKITKLK